MLAFPTEGAVKSILAIAVVVRFAHAFLVLVTCESFLSTLPTSCHRGKGAMSLISFIPSLLLSSKPQYFVKMTTIPDLEEIKATFSILDDWEDRYAYLIDLGRKLPPYPDAARDEAHIVKGCTSQVWMILTINDGRLAIMADSDAHIVRGLIALVIAVYDCRSVSEVASIDMEGIFKELGLSEHLSPNRRNGFFAMVGKIQSVSL